MAPLRKITVRDISDKAFYEFLGVSKIGDARKIFGLGNLSKPEMKQKMLESAKFADQLHAVKAQKTASRSSARKSAIQNRPIMQIHSDLIKEPRQRIPLDVEIVFKAFTWFNHKGKISKKETLISKILKYQRPKLNLCPTPCH